MSNLKDIVKLFLNSALKIKMQLNITGFIKPTEFKCY